MEPGFYGTRSLHMFATREKVPITEPKDFDDIAYYTDVLPVIFEHMRFGAKRLKSITH